MTRVPIMSGMTMAETGQFVTSVPVNREPVTKDIGLSDGYLEIPPGIRQVATGPGADRGGLAWNGACYRVMGTKLCRVNADWSVDILGDVGSGPQCALDYNFTDLIIASPPNLYYWNTGNGLRQVTDQDLGVVIDMIFVDGYTMTTDGSDIVVNDLDNPMNINPLKFGAIEETPDPVTGLMRMHGEVYVFTTTGIFIFQNVGGTDFPFAVIKTATTPYGCVGPRAKCKAMGTAAFVGGPANASPGVYLLGAGEASKISIAEVDADLGALTLAELAAVILESRVECDEERIIVHTPYRSWSMATSVTKATQTRAWCQYCTSTTGAGLYEGRGLTWCYGTWVVGSSSGQIGVLDHMTAQHYGADIGWRFDTTLLYNESRKALLKNLELIGTPGRGNSDSRIFWSYTKDGETWSQERATSAGKLGERRKRIAWRTGTRFEQYMGLRFRGVDASLAAIARLECDIEPLG